MQSLQTAQKENWCSSEVYYISALLQVCLVSVFWWCTLLGLSKNWNFALSGFPPTPQIYHSHLPLWSAQAADAATCKHGDANKWKSLHIKHVSREVGLNYSSRWLQPNMSWSTLSSTCERLSFTLSMFWPNIWLKSQCYLGQNPHFPQRVYGVDLLAKVWNQMQRCSCAFWSEACAVRVYICEGVSLLVETYMLRRLLTNSLNNILILLIICMGV